ncbi:HPr family phosphocarrier protein [Actinomyces sp. W5033]|uniref:PTS sugar transporter subunit IIA domain-containing protein n=1 Tax=Actinomyces sp. W5033 TaxID=3446479 RepID=UPI003EE1E7AE
MTALPSCAERARQAPDGHHASHERPSPRDGRPLTAVLVVSHSVQLAEGVGEIITQMAPQVLVRAVGGGPDGGVGTDPAAVEAAVRELLEAGHEVLITTDLGSALMVAQMAVETVLAEEGAPGPGVDGAQPAVVVDVPVAQGSLAAAVEASCGSGATACARAARTVMALWDDAARAHAPAPQQEPAASRPLYVSDPAGLHARPAAQLAVLLEAERSHLWIEGRPATTLAQLLVTGVTGAGRVEATAVGPDPATTLERVQRLLAGEVGPGSGRVPDAADEPPGQGAAPLSPRP